MICFQRFAPVCIAVSVIRQCLQPWSCHMFIAIPYHRITISLPW